MLYGKWQQAPDSSPGSYTVFPFHFTGHQNTSIWHSKGFSSKVMSAFSSAVLEVSNDGYPKYAGQTTNPVEIFYTFFQNIGKLVLQCAQIFFNDRHKFTALHNEINAGDIISRPIGDVLVVVSIRRFQRSGFDSRRYQIF
jgi:hypothetical protein